MERPGFYLYLVIDYLSIIAIRLEPPIEPWPFQIPSVTQDIQVIDFTLLVLEILHQQRESQLFTCQCLDSVGVRLNRRVFVVKLNQFLYINFDRINLILIKVAGHDPSNFLLEGNS